MTATPTPPWFLGAPVSKAIALFTALSYVIIETVLGGGLAHTALSLDMDKILNDGQFYRIFVCHLTFGSVGELVMGLFALCPLMRRFEREMGSRKFGTFALFTTILSTAWEIMLSQVLHDVKRYSGPYPLLGSLLLLYHIYTPRLHPRFFGFLGFDFSEKSLTYILCLQVTLYGGLGTIVPTACGMVAGFLCTSPALPLQKWELPNFFYRICSVVGAGFVESEPAIMGRRQSGQRGGGLGAARGIQGNRQQLVPDMRFGGGGGGIAAQPEMNNGLHAAAQQRFHNVPAAPPPPEESINQLTSMGFDRESVVRVLSQCDNNVEVAANRLLSGA